jgi:tetratricopeptide (TPR) repeat protein
VDDDATRQEAPPETPSYLSDAEGPRRAPLERGEVVGRYIILDELGAGAMGAVYRAYDPELDRKVALKLILAQFDSVGATVAARVRLQREAQAMAKLSHPNVIAIYDVGTHGNEVFIAMELVAGISLAEWIDRHRASPVAQTARGWRKVRDVFTQAGRGLAAAHAAGIIHRDFKPANALVGNDGRVRVLDFGLARPESDDGTELEQPDAPAGSTGEFRRADIDADLTVAGTVMGTPAYMAPEQHQGTDIDARVDQYAFCVALYEALYGERPWPKGDIRSQYEAKLAPLPPAPAGAIVPDWLHHILARGLSMRRNDRYPTMDALLVRLARRPTRGRGRMLIAGAAVAGLAGGALAMLLVGDPPPQGCTPAAQRLAGVWDEKRRAEVSNAFADTELVFAAGVFDGTAEVLDDYAARWSALHESTCADQTASDGVADELAVRRRACLDRRLDELRALTDLLADADVGVVDFAVPAVHELVPVERCADDDALLRRLQPPSDPELRSLTQGVRATLAEASAQRDAGRYEAAFAAATKAVEDAAPYEPVKAEALFVRGTIEQARGDHRTAADTLHEAAWLATANLHDEVAARAWVALVLIVGYELADYAYAERISGLARASLRAAGEPAELTATLLSNEAAVAHQRGQYDRALKAQEQALNLLETLFGPEHPRVARSLNNLGLELRAQGRHEAALEAHRRALEIKRASLGEQHPGVVTTINHIGNVHFAMRELDEATADYERACELARAAWGTEHASRADCLSNLGAAAFLRGDLEEAAAHHEQALALRKRLLGPDHPDVATALNNLALAEAAAGRADAALAHHQQALTIKRSVLDPHHPSLARSLSNIGRLMLRLDSPRPALARFEEAREILSASLGPDHVELATVLTGIARARLALDERADALEPASRAVEILEQKGGSPIRVAEARFALARALPTGESERARTLAAAARETYAAAGAATEPELRAIDAFLAAR